MKKFRNLLAILFVFASSISFGTESKAIEVEMYCAHTYNNCGAVGFCADNVDDWLVMWDISNWWCGL